jgi:hypothetical protein
MTEAADLQSAPQGRERENLQKYGKKREWKRNGICKEKTVDKSRFRTYNMLRAIL